MASLSIFLPFHLLLLIIFPSTTSLIWASETGFRIGINHVDHGSNFTKLQLVQRSIARHKHRLGRLSSGGSNNSVRAPVVGGEGEYLMNISIGTPWVPFSGIMDTGSDLIWTQCAPCTTCFNQSTPLYNPSNSTTFSNVSCDDDLCKDVNVFKCENGCKYLYSYGDQSSTEGFLGTETITFSDSVSKPKLGFGCGVNNQGTGLAQGSGLVGLGRGQLSLISQLQLGKFSYCLTTMGENKTSSVLFGELADLNYTTSTSDSPTSSTPLVQNPSQPTFYYVNLEGISVGETLLPVPKSVFAIGQDGNGGLIFDSGTTLTYLPEEAFDELKKEFVSQIKLKVSKDSDATGLDLCFELPTKDLTEIEIPKLKFHFQGVDLDLPSENYMIADESSGLMCLALAATSGVSIFGNIQQQNHLVLYDIQKEEISFVPTQCDQIK